MECETWDLKHVVVRFAFPDRDDGGGWMASWCGVVRF
jgi:hypothetical protein